MILPADGTTMNQRRRIAASGVISVAIAIGRDNALRGTPDIALEGIPVEEDRDAFVAETLHAVIAAAGTGGDEAKLREAVRLAVRRCATDWTGKKPVVDVLLVRV